MDYSLLVNGTHKVVNQSWQSSEILCTETSIEPMVCSGRRVVCPNWDLDLNTSHGRLTGRYHCPILVWPTRSDHSLQRLWILYISPSIMFYLATSSPSPWCLNPSTNTFSSTKTCRRCNSYTDTADRGSVTPMIVRFQSLAAQIGYIGSARRWRSRKCVEMLTSHPQPRGQIENFNFSSKERNYFPIHDYSLRFP